MSNIINLPKIPIGKWVDAFVVFLSTYFGGFFDLVTEVGETIIVSFSDALLWAPPIITILVLAGLIGLLTNYKIALGTTIGLLLIYNLGMWEPGMNTLALVLSSTVLALVIGIPIGILTAWNDLADRISRPVLDFMQTMPPFVYLVPAVILFDIGEAGMVTVISPRRSSV